MVYRFRQLDVSNIGPFGDDNILCFPDGVTFICGGNGLGKTTIARGLLHRAANARLEHTGNLDRSIPDWILSFDDAAPLPYGGEQWIHISDLQTARRFPTLDWNQVAEATALGIRDLLEEKVHASKFTGVIESSAHIKVAFDPDFRVNIFDGISGQDLNWGFEALGERVVLYLAFNRAIRAQLGDAMDVPFVVDSCLEYLDMGLMPAAQRFISRMAAQVILFANCVVRDKLNLHPDYEIRLETGSDKSKLYKCSNPPAVA